MSIHLPEHLIPDLNDDEMRNFLRITVTLWRDCVDEYFDEDHLRRGHFKNSTYLSGCKGPLCTAAARRQVRLTKNITTPSDRYIYIEPLLDYFWDSINAEDEESRLILKSHLRSQLRRNHAV